MTDTQSKTSGRRLLYAWLGPILTFLLLAGVMAFLVEYWKTATPAESSLTAEARAALNESQPAARPRGPVGLSVPPLQIPGKGYIRTLSRDANSSSWGVISGPYLLRVVQPANSTAFDYSYMVRSESVYSGTDEALVALALQVILNPMDRQHSGASAADVQALTTQFNGGQSLNWLPLKVADADAKSAQDFWLQYKDSTAATHTAVGGQLLDALAVVGKKSLAANQSTFDDTMAQLRKIVTPDKEAAYRAGIQAAKAPLPPVRTASPTTQQ